MADKENTASTSPGWEREVLEKLALAAITEQRQARRWGIFFKFLLFAYFFIILVMMYDPLTKEPRKTVKEHTAVLDITGMIVSGADADGDSLIQGLRSAVKNKSAKGLILRINSPGGSPVQSANVFNEIRRIKQERPDLPIYAVVDDICTSGAYFVAAATDKIFVNPSSLIGSIGVIMNSFGFVEALEKVGVERRQLTAGEHKALFDPFSPLRESEQAHMQAVLDQVHQQFIDAVKTGRGDRLKETSEIFSGLVWTGADSLKLGLVDGIGTRDYVARELIGAEELVNYTPRKRLLDRLAGTIGTVAGNFLWNMAQGLGEKLR